MRSAGRRLFSALAAAAAVAATALIATVVAPVTHAQAATCTSPQVAIVVNFGHWGKPVQRACANWSSSLTGYTLLNNYGFATVGTHHDGPAFICRISLNGTQTYYPSAADEACNVTPPASAYWSYWHAQQGATTWQYSQLGATGYHPTKGSVDVWTFGATDVNGTTGQPPFPPSAVLPAPGPSAGSPHSASKHPPATSASTHSSAGSDGRAAPGRTTATTPGSHSGSSLPGGSNSARTASPSTASSGAAIGHDANGAPGTVGTRSAATVQEVAGKPAARSKAAGTAGPLLATVGLVVALGAGGLFLVRRRRTGT